MRTTRITSLFITGTDTGVGKTYFCSALLKALNQQGQRTIGFKPIASGCHHNAKQQLRNDDALILQQSASVLLPYALVNPVALQPEIAPHIAAEQSNRNVTTEELCQHYQRLLSYKPDTIVIEGAGGWYTPLNQDHTLANFVIQQELPVILVVGIRLGCLNHAILTEQAIRNDGLHIIGWIASVIEPNMPALKENIATLQNRLNAPQLKDLRSVHSKVE